MGFFGDIFGIFGFVFGFTAGLVIGYYLFIYVKPSDVKDPKLRPLFEYDSKSLERLLSEIPLWVKNPDYDRVDWLNKFIGWMWPYLDKAICKMVKDIAKPIIAENTKKFKIDSVEFEALTLGSLPPIFQGIKVYTTEEKELIMKLPIKWAGNPNITVVVKAFGLKATVQAVDLQVFLAPRITLKPLVSTFPCFAKIFVSLMDKPHVDFGLKLLGADVMSIPGLYRFIQDKIKNQVANMYLWPKTLEVVVMKAPKVMKKPDGILYVNILKAQKLRNKDLFAIADPYMKRKLLDDWFPSNKNRALNPDWNRNFMIFVTDPESQVFELSVYDWEKVDSHEIIGIMIIKLKDLMPDVPKLLKLDLLKNSDPNDDQNDKLLGKLITEVTYKPFKEDEFPEVSENAEEVEKAPEGTPSGGGLLVVTIHEAQDLEGKHHTNPYVRITFRGEEKKTKHIKKNRDPRWEEEFQFVCEEPPVSDKMHLEVRSRPPRIGIYSKETLGYVNISLADVVAKKRINEKYHLIDSKDGRIQVKLQWKPS